MVGFGCCCLFFGYHSSHRSRCASAGAWAPPASSRSVCSLSRRFSPARRRGGADRSLRRLGVARGMDSNISQVTGPASTASSGLRLPHQNAIAATSRHQCGPCAPWSRASASACVNTQTVQGPSTKGRSKFEATTDATDAPRARPCFDRPCTVWVLTQAEALARLQGAHGPH